MDESPKTMNQLRKLDPQTKEFEANGILYTVTDFLSIDRLRMYRKISIELGLTTTYKEVYDTAKRTISRCEDLLAGKKTITEIIYDNFNLLHGLKNIEDKEDPAMWIATLFINGPDEDIRWFEIEVMKNKIKNWKEAGIDSSFFLGFAISLLADFQPVFSEATQIYLVNNPQEVIQ